MISVESLYRDFAVFADPATEPVIIEGQDAFDVRLSREAEDFRFMVDRHTGGVRISGDRKSVV